MEKTETHISGKEINFSFIIPVYNRPNETEELMESMLKLEFDEKFEIVIVEDGSTIDSENVIAKYKDLLEISYFKKPNSGPGDSRNYGMARARGNYFLILDSDCILPENYLISVKNALTEKFVDCFGGPDAAHNSFTDIQKAINFTMTSFLTTGGIRGGDESLAKFQPRSFNMGLSKEAFEKSGGFGKIHPGEDPDLSIRLWEMGYETTLIKTAYVYHKRRIDWSKFYMQVNKFGKARPILNKRYPKYAKITYWFPSLFLIGFLGSLVLALFCIPYFLLMYAFYYILLFGAALIKTGSLKIALYSLLASCIQFYGYGIGFLNSFFRVSILNEKPEDAFPKMFFK